MDWYDLKDILLTLFFAVITVVLVMGLVVGTIAGIDAITQINYCKTMDGLHTDFEFIWKFWGGCLVKTPSGYWIKASEYNYLEGDVR